MRKREAGYCEVGTPTGAWHLPREEFAKVRAAWIRGCAFVDTVDFFGAPLTIKFDTVDSITDSSPDAVMARIEEKRADAMDDELAGGTA